MYRKQLTINNKDLIRNQLNIAIHKSKAGFSKDEKYPEYISVEVKISKSVSEHVTFALKSVDGTGKLAHYYNMRNHLVGRNLLVLPDPE